METEQTEHRGFVLEGAWGDYSRNMSVFVFGNALHRLAVVGIPSLPRPHPGHHDGIPGVAGGATEPTQTPRGPVFRGRGQKYFLTH